MNNRASLSEFETIYLAVTESLDAGVVVHTPNGRIVSHNPAAAKILNLPVDENGKIVSDDLTWSAIREDGRPFLPGEHPAQVAVRTGEPQDGVIMGLSTDSSNATWLKVNARPLINQGERNAYAAVSTFIDVTETQTAEERYRNVVESQTEMVLRYRPDRTITFANEVLAQQFKVNPEDIVGNNLLSLLTPASRVAYEEVYNKLQPGENGQIPSVLLELPYEDGEGPDGLESMWSEWAGMAFFDRSGEIYEYQFVGRDITDRILAQQEAEGNRRHLERVLVHLPIPLIEFNSKETILRCNDAAKQLFDEPVETNSQLPTWMREERLYERIVSTANDSGDAPPFEVQIDNKVFFVNGGIVESDIVVALFSDITAEKRTEQELAWEATHDSLTKLPNRSLLLDHLDHALARNMRHVHRLGLLFIDLDGFKGVNDTFGHLAGDQVLQVLTDRFTASSREGDIVSRVGGDEFVIVCENLNSVKDLEEVAQRIVEAASNPVSLDDDDTVSISASVGGVTARTGESKSSLLGRADSAMYQAKHNGKATYKIL